MSSEKERLPLPPTLQQNFGTSNLGSTFCTSKAFLYTLGHGTPVWILKLNSTEKFLLRSRQCTRHGRLSQDYGSILFYNHETLIFFLFIYTSFAQQDNAVIRFPQSVPSVGNFMEHLICHAKHRIHMT